MFRRSLILLLVGACSYQESVGTAAFGADGGVMEPTTGGGSGGGSAGSGSGGGGGSAMDPTYGDTPAHILSDGDECAFSARGAELYCLNSDINQSTTDGSIRVHIRRITDAQQIVVDGTLTGVFSVDNMLAQDADHVYFSAQVAPATQYSEWSWSIYSFDKQAHTFAQVSTGWNEMPRRLQVIGGTLYFFAFEHVPENTTYHYDRLYSVPLAGGNAKLLTTAIVSAEAVTTDGTYIYAADFGRYQVTAVQIAPPHRVLTLVTTGVPWDTAACPPQSLFVHGDWLYYGTQGSTSAIRRIPRPTSGTTQETVSTVSELIASNKYQAISMATDGTSLYWTEWFEGLYRAPLDGSAPRELLLTFHEQGNNFMGMQGDMIYFNARHASTGSQLIAKYDLSP